MKFEKYNIVEFLPLLLVIAILIGFRSSFPLCSKNKECFGNLLLVVSFMAGIFNFAIFKWTQKIESKISYYSKLQKRRLFVGGVLWTLLFVFILFEKIT